MLSALDRQRRRILLRQNNQHLLKHELAHLYLDLRWKILPYPVAEPFAVAMESEELCPIADHPLTNEEDLRGAWRTRTGRGTCDLLQLLKEVLKAEAPLRDSLPLR